MLNCCSIRSWRTSRLAWVAKRVSFYRTNWNLNIGRSWCTDNGLLRSKEVWRSIGNARSVSALSSQSSRATNTFAGFIAKKLCPDLILIPINFSRYTEMSGKVMTVFKSYDPNMAVAGCDEGYLKCMVLIISLSMFQLIFCLQYYFILPRTWYNRRWMRGRNAG